MAEEIAGKAGESWDETVVRVLKSNQVRLIAYVPDKVLAPLIKRIHADEYFTVICPAREEEVDGAHAATDNSPRASDSDNSGAAAGRVTGRLV